VGGSPLEVSGTKAYQAFVPLTYGRHALGMAIFYSSSEQFGLDMAVLAISALVAVGLGILAMRRGIAG